MASAPDSGASAPDPSPGLGHCAVLPGKTLHSHSASPGTGEFNAGGNPAMDQHPIQGGAEIFPVASCHGNRDKLRPDGPPRLVCRLRQQNCKSFCIAINQMQESSANQPCDRNTF